MKQDHNRGGAKVRRAPRWGVRAAAGLGALGLVAGGVTASVSTAGAQTAPHAKFLACMITDTGGIGDKSFNYSAYLGLQLAVKKIGTTKASYDLVQTPSNGGPGYPAEINSLLGKHCGIIVTVGFLMDSATGNAASANPNQKFAIVDDVPSTTSKELLDLTYDTNQDAFLGGALSAAESKTGVVSTYGGIQIPPVTIYMDGFVAGVRWYDKTFKKHVKVLGWTPTPGRNYKDGNFDGSGVFTGDFTNQQNGKTVSQTFFGEHADIVFPVAGSVGLGSVAAVQATSGKHYVDWVDTDGCISVSVEGAIYSAFKGTFKGGVYTGTLKNGGVALTVDKKAIIETAAEKTMLANATKGIENGSISVDPNKYPIP